MKITIIGAGSLSFALGALQDVALSERLKEVTPLEICLMDIIPENLAKTYQFSSDMFTDFNSHVTLIKTTSLEESLTGAEFVIVAIEVDRYHYWSQDFHIPRNYGSKQIYGENGGPGSMFHTLRNLPPMLEIAYKMEEICPEAWLINYTNPEAKLVEAITKMTSIKVIGLCHGLEMGLDQIAEFTDVPKSELGFEGGGLNHFGFFTKLWHKETGEDLYPLLRKREREANPLAQFDHMGLSRNVLHLYGLYPYPGTNHIGEYLPYAEDFYAGLSLQFRYDPVIESAWGKDDKELTFIYSASGEHLDAPLFGERGAGTIEEKISKMKEEDSAYLYKRENVKNSGEYAIPIIEALYFDEELFLPAANLPNKDAIKGLPFEMVVETQAIVKDGKIELLPMELELPTALIGSINVQGTIHKLIIEAYVEKSKRKLMQAILLDPQAPSYYQAAAMIDDLCERQKEILPELSWEN